VPDPMNMLLVLAALQLLVSIRLCMSAAYTPQQKTAQMFLIWLVPVIGACVVYFFLRSNNASSRMRDTKFVAQKDLSYEEMTSLSDQSDR
jgi:hypothetical protein